MHKYPSTKDADQKRISKAEQLIKQGELSHASRLLTSTGLAPGNQSTLEELRDPRLRPADPLRAIPECIQSYKNTEQIELDFELFTQNLKSARRGLSAGVGGIRDEHLKVVLEDECRCAS